MSDLKYKKSIKLNKELYDNWDRSTARKVRLFLTNSQTIEDEKSDLKHIRFLMDFFQKFKSILLSDLKIRNFMQQNQEQFNEIIEILKEDNNNGRL